MHPLIARFLDPAAARAVLDKAAQGLALDPDEAALLAEARREPATEAALRKVGPRAPAELQPRLIVLAVQAATARILEDAELGPPARAALAALGAEGATEAEALTLVAQAVMEEAFGYADDPAAFDRAYLRETLEVLVALARVDQALVDGWLEDWGHAGDPASRALRLTVAEVVLESAWGEGPQPITPEHVDDALERLAETVSESEVPLAAEQVVKVLEFLSARGVVGAERLARLSRLVGDAARAAAADPDEGGEVEEDEDD
jgi:hypothetical protein